MWMKLKHLTREEHEELARLLNQAQDNLKAAARIVARAPYTDATLRSQKVVQEKLIDQLSEAWMDKLTWGYHPYQSVGYILK